MKPAPFGYARPGTLDEAVALKAEHGEDALVLAGGQSLVPLLALRLASPSLLIDVNELDDLAYVREEEGWLRIGATARHRDVEESVDLARRAGLPAEAAPLIGHRAIRNRGTVVGSIAHADPAAEWPAVALALDATVEAVGPSGPRSVAADEFFLAPFTSALGPDEIVREVRFRMPGPGAGTAFEEHARRHGDFALVGVAAVVVLGEDGVVSVARIALAGVGGTPARAVEAERELEGGPLTVARVRAAAEACARGIDPPGDVHASSAYRRHLVGVLVGRCLRRAGERARAA
jgi:carbon-monoxide dehydrogenase medium subunit